MAAGFPGSGRGACRDVGWRVESGGGDGVVAVRSMGDVVMEVKTGAVEVE